MAHHLPYVLIFDFFFFKDIEVTLGLKYPKCIGDTLLFFFLHFMIFGGFADIIL